MSQLAQPLYFVLRFLYLHGASNWGWTIILFTVLFNLLLMGPRLVAMRSSLQRLRLEPRIKAIKARYGPLKFNDPRQNKMNAEIMALYQDEGAGILSGCLPMLPQLLLFPACFHVLRTAQELHQAHWLWLADLSAPDPLHILPILILASMFLTQLITPIPGISRQQRRWMALLMPAVMGFGLWHYASGLALYWATGSLINLFFQFGINRSPMGREMHTLALCQQKTGAEGVACD